jgi:hypothetical protein
MNVSGSGVGLLVVLVAIMGFFYVTSANAVPSASGNFFDLMLIAFAFLVAFVFIGMRGRARAGF